MTLEANMVCTQEEFLIMLVGQEVNETIAVSEISLN